MAIKTPQEIAAEYVDARTGQHDTFYMPDRYAFRAAIESAIGEYARERDTEDRAIARAKRNIVGKCNRLEPNECSVCRTALEHARRLERIKPW